VCITELDLPGSSGAELVRRLQAAAPALTLIVCSARDAPELGVVAQAGAYCMSKPLDPAGLARVIAEARAH
jgi:DNA-binding response OmpR family regulator